MAMPEQKLVELAKTLPPRLLNFFRKFPPRQIASSTIAFTSEAEATTTTTATEAAAVTTTTTTTTTATTTTSSTSSSPSNRHVLASHPISDPTYNPFLPWKNPSTGRWRGAMYGLRKQADICKLARKYGVEDMLPFSRKKSSEKEKRKAELGLRVKGTGVGQKVKGHYWERTLQNRQEDRRKAMLAMPELIREWKVKGHGRRWRQWPKK